MTLEMKTWLRTYKNYPHPKSLRKMTWKSHFSLLRSHCLISLSFRLHGFKDGKKRRTREGEKKSEFIIEMTLRELRVLARRRRAICLINEPSGESSWTPLAVLCIRLRYTPELGLGTAIKKVRHVRLAHTHIHVSI